VPDEVELSVPAKPELLSLARLTVAALAARADFDYEEIEDLRLAIDELCSPLVGTRGRPGQLHLRYQWDRSWLEVSCSVAVTGDGASGEDDSGERELSDRILEALVDEHGSTTDGDVVSVWLRKRRPGHSD
jgi:serine/threonine-protein kinase RsbW